METWFTGDTHFSHENIIKYCKRPFKSVKIMNDTLIRNWNSRIQKNDFVIFLGDFCFKENPEKYLQFLNGQITFIQGNHDHNNSLNTKVQYVVVNLAGKDIYCTHRPEDFSSSYSINLVGHIHEKWKVRKVYNTYLVNVGVDVWNFAPVNINEILKAISDFNEEEKK